MACIRATLCLQRRQARSCFGPAYVVLRRLAAGCSFLVLSVKPVTASHLFRILHVVPSHLELLLFLPLVLSISFSSLLVSFSSSLLSSPLTLTLTSNPTSTTTTVMKLTLSVNKPLNGHTFQAADKVQGRVIVQLDDISETPEVRVIFQGEYSSTGRHTQERETSQQRWTWMQAQKDSDD